MSESTWELIYSTLGMIREREEMIAEQKRIGQRRERLMVRRNRLASNIHRNLQRLKLLIDRLDPDALLVRDHVFYLDADGCVMAARVTVGTGNEDAISFSDEQLREAAQHEASLSALEEAAENLDVDDAIDAKDIMSGEDGDQTAIRTAWGSLRLDGREPIAPDVP